MQNNFNMELNKLQKEHPEYFQFFEEEIKTVDLPKSDYNKTGRKPVIFEKLNSERGLSYPFYKNISRIISNKLQ